LEEPRWPPRREDLLRFYEVEGLSAARIANLYGLKHPNPKSSETLVLYHLKKFGIRRRDPADHVRKITEETANEWATRYASGESLKQIAGPGTSPATVWNHLKKRGVVLRDKVDAQIKAVTIHHKLPFCGSEVERAYIYGLSLGDFLCVRHGRSVRARLGTTHPAMIALFCELLSSYGPIYKYPKKSNLTGFEWNLDCDLDPSFSFLLDPQGWLGLMGESDEKFLAFLAGFFDADGSVYFHKKAGAGGFELTLTNMNRDLLECISTRLRKMGFSPKLRLDPQNPNRGVKNGKDSIFRLALWRYGEVARLLGLLPLRNPEKVGKAQIALSLQYGSPPSQRTEVVERWTQLTNSIKLERDECVREASRVFQERHFP